jgi:hypothetical protein
MNTSLFSPSLSRRVNVEPQLHLEDINAGVWWDIKRILFSFQHHQSTDPAQAAQLINAMVSFHADMRDKPPYMDALQYANTVNRGDSAWVKRLLLQDSDMYVQLITYFGDYSTPIHDYPELAIVNLPLSGRVCIDYYHLGHAALESAYPIARLRRIETHVYGVCEATMAFPWQKNIQEIRSITERSVVLSAGLIPTGSREKSWYLPISPQNTDAFFAQRLKRNE